jgi:uncharacterized membrane protein required for colicin V production
MNSLDLVLLALTALSVGLGLWRGVIRESLAVLAWLLGFPLASHFAPDVRLWLDLSDTSPALSYMLAWILVFMVVWLIIIPLILVGKSFSIFQHALKECVSNNTLVIKHSVLFPNNFLNGPCGAMQKALRTGKP